MPERENRGDARFNLTRFQEAVAAQRTIAGPNFGQHLGGIMPGDMDPAPRVAEDFPNFDWIDVMGDVDSNSPAMSATSSSDVVPGSPADGFTGGMRSYDYLGPEPVSQVVAFSSLNNQQEAPPADQFTDAVESSEFANMPVVGDVLGYSPGDPADILRQQLRDEEEKKRAAKALKAAADAAAPGAGAAASAVAGAAGAAFGSTFGVNPPTSMPPVEMPPERIRFHGRPRKKPPPGPELMAEGAVPESPPFVASPPFGSVSPDDALGVPPPPPSPMSSQSLVIGSELKEPLIWRDPVGKLAEREFTGTERSNLDNYREVDSAISDFGYNFDNWASSVTSHIRLLSERLRYLRDAVRSEGVDEQV